MGVRAGVPALELREKGNIGGLQVEMSGIRVRKSRQVVTAQAKIRKVEDR